MEAVTIKPKKRMTMKKRRAIAGYLFIIPFIIGFLLFFIKPFVQSITFSFSEIVVDQNGYVPIGVGVNNFKKALFEHPTYLRTLTECVQSMVSSVPITLIFSFFAAVLLNQRFKGSALARAVFFLPVILTTGAIATLEKNDFMLEALRNGTGAQTGGAVGGMLNTVNLREILQQTKMNATFIVYITGAIDGVYNIIFASGVQMLIFLSGLQSVPASLYEASTIEGATGWENFWKITFPMVSPLIVVNLLYSIIDNMTAATNPMMRMVQEVAFQQTSYGYATAMAWIYFLVVMVVLVVSVSIISRRVFYQV